MKLAGTPGRLFAAAGALVAVFGFVVACDTFADGDAGFEDATTGADAAGRTAIEVELFATPEREV